MSPSPTTKTSRSWTKARAWPGKDLKGFWRVTIKIDGVRSFCTIEKGWHSRNDKPLYNLPVIRGDGPVEGYEAYDHSPKRSSKENFKATIKAVRAKNKPERALGVCALYTLDPIDHRLDRGDIENPTAARINSLLRQVLREGYEGLILRQGDTWYKVKPKETFDVTVLGAIEGVGKHKGRLGALVTTRGKVGTGFSDEERESIWKKVNHGLNKVSVPGYKGSFKVLPFIIEVSCMSLTADGKFRHPGYERIRTDKSETDDPA